MYILKMTCPVCIANITKLNKTITCLYCQFESCSACTRKYLLDTTNDPHCMNCRHGWSRAFLDSNFPKTFLRTDLKRHRQDVLLEREKAFLPDTLPYAECEQKRRTLANRYKETLAQFEALTREKREINSRLNDLRRDLMPYHSALYRINVQESNLGFIHPPGGASTSTPQPKPVLRCINPNDCRGYLDADTHTCSICNTIACPECMKPAHPDEECNKDDLATIRLLQRSSRPCPGCQTPCIKEGGCDQVWCLGCKKAFSWSKMKLETGVIHSPDYYNYIRRINNGVVPRHPAEAEEQNPCPANGNLNLVTNRQVLQHLRVTQIPEDEQHPILEFHRTINHVRAYELPDQPDDQEELRKLRIKYLLNDITKDEFKQQIQIREKKTLFATERREIISTFLDTINLLFHRMLREQQVQPIYQEMLTLQDHFNNAMTDLSIRYGYTTATHIKGNSIMRLKIKTEKE